MDNRRNSYRLLRLQPEAPPELITRVYRTLMQQMRYHPDLGGDTHQASLINQAYRRLMDPHERARENRVLVERGLYPAKIGSGPVSTYNAHAATARHGNINRRHYARVLMLQLDAENALLNSAKAWAARTSPSARTATLLGRAHATLADPTTRARYLELLTAHSHHGALRTLEQDTLAHAEAARLAQAAREDTTETPACPYCALAPLRITSTPDPRCTRCDSPLSPPPTLADTQRRRQASRLHRPSHATVSTGWPPRRSPARVIDMSPVGVSFESATVLHHVTVLRLDANGVSAVVELTHGSTTPRGYAYGGRFLSAVFDTDHGTFVRATA
ncbi:MAG: J domain-containing protein [Pseudomonadota bacterium]